MSCTRSRSSAVISLLTLAFLFTPLTAHAGSYSGPVYTSTGTSVNAPPTTATNYALSNGSFGGGGSSPSSYPDSHGNPTSASITCSGPIAATFTWNDGGDHNDLPPPNAIVTENCQTFWDCTNYPGTTYSGSCANPLGGSPIANVSGVGQTWNFTKYWVQSNPGASFSVSCSPGANATTTGSSQAYGQGSASAYYSASLSPVTINLQGVTLDANGHNPQVLTGQQISASLNAPFSTNAYEWSASGGDPFSLYDPSAASNQLTALPQPDTQPGFTFYTKQAGQVTVNCIANVITPENPPQYLIVTGQKKFASVKPTVTRWDIIPGYVQHPSTYVWQLGLDPNSRAPDGMSWKNITIDVPKPFSGGQGGLAQTVKPDHEIFKNDGTIIKPLNNGQKGLDSQFPYNPAWSIPALGNDGDAPNLTVGANAQGYQGYDKVTVNDAFSTWVMYYPPPNGNYPTVWVPLQSYDWNWSLTLNWQNNQWVQTQAFPSDPTSEPTYQRADTATPPTWDVVQTGY